MTSQLNVTTLYTLAVGLGLVLLITLAVVAAGVRRVLAIRRQALSLNAEHERLFVHAQARMAAQKQLALAEQTAGDERHQHLEQALDLWRQALRTRDPADAYAQRFINDQIAMVEGDLAAADGH